MTNLSQNIKKFVCIKMVDIIEIVIFVVLMFFVMVIFTNIFYLISSLVIIVVSLFIVQDKIKKMFNKWTVPVLSTEENKKYLMAETLYLIIFSIVVFIIFFRYINYKFLIFVLGALFLIREVPKWYRFNKLAKVEKNG